MASQEIDLRDFVVEWTGLTDTAPTADDSFVNPVVLACINY